MLIVSLGIAIHPPHSYSPLLTSTLSLSLSLSLLVQARHPLPDPDLEKTLFTPLKVPQRLSRILLRNEGVLKGQKKNVSSTSNPTLTSRSLKLIASFVPLAISGYVFGLIRLIARYLGMLIVRAAWPRRCEYTFLLHIIDPFYFYFYFFFC